MSCGNSAVQQPKHPQPSHVKKTFSNQSSNPNPNQNPSFQQQSKHQLMRDFDGVVVMKACWKSCRMDMVPSLFDYNIWRA